MSSFAEAPGPQGQAVSQAAELLRQHRQKVLRGEPAPASSAGTAQSGDSAESLISLYKQDQQRRANKPRPGILQTVTSLPGRILKAGGQAYHPDSNPTSFTPFKPTPGSVPAAPELTPGPSAEEAELRSRLDQLQQDFDAAVSAGERKAINQEETVIREQLAQLTKTRNNQPTEPKPAPGNTSTASPLAPSASSEKSAGGIDLSGVKKATFDKLKTIGGGLTYVATHPALWPGIAWRGSTSWAENVVHPLNVMRKVAANRGKATPEEFKQFLAWSLGAAEGTIETGFIYAALPPGVARLARAGISLAISQGPAALYYLAEVREKGNIYKNTPDKSEAALKVKEMQEKHTRASSFLKEFSAGRASAGFVVAAFSPSGLIEIAAEKVVHGTGLDFDTIREGIYTKATGKNAIDRIIESNQSRLQGVLDNTDIKDVVNKLTDEQVKIAYADSSLTEDQIPQKAQETFEDRIRQKTASALEKDFKNIVRNYLTKDPKDIDGAIKAGQDQLAKANQISFDTPEEKQEWFDGNKNILQQALDEEKAKQAAAATPIAQPTTTATPVPAQPTATPSPAAQPAAPSKPSPDIKAAPNFDKALTELKVNQTKLSAETLAKVQERFNEKSGSVPLADIVLSEQKAAIVGAHMDQIDRATDEAIRQTGLAGKLNAEARQILHKALQKKAEALVDQTFERALGNPANTDINNLIVTTNTEFRQNLAGVLSKDSLKEVGIAYAAQESDALINAHQADFEKAAKEGVVAALKNREDTHAVISPLIYDHAVETAKNRAYDIAWKNVSDNVTKVDVADPDQAHLQQAIQVAAAEGRKKFEAQLTSPDSLKITHDRVADVINYHLNQDDSIRAQINQVLVEVNPGHSVEPTAVEHYTSVTIKPGQTVSHIFLEAKQPLHFNPTDARPLAAFIATNYDQLADMHYAFEQAGNLEADNFYPVNLDDLYYVMKAAESGDIDARRKLMQAVWMIQAGKNVKLVSIEDQAKIINILERYRWGQK